MGCLTSIRRNAKAIKSAHQFSEPQGGGDVVFLHGPVLGSQDSEFVVQSCIGLHGRAGVSSLAY